MILYRSTTFLPSRSSSPFHRGTTLPLKGTSPDNDGSLILLLVLLDGLPEPPFDEHASSQTLQCVVCTVQDLCESSVAINVGTDDVHGTQYHIPILVSARRRRALKPAGRTAN
jgi:hypothetical protein